MTSDRSATRIVRSWLEEGVTALPEQVLDAVLDQLPATRQRHRGWRRLRDRFRAQKALAYAGAAIFLVLVATGGVGLLTQPNPGRGAGAGRPAIAALPLPAEGNVLQPGATYRVGSPLPVRITFVAPAGWSACRIGSAEVDVCGDPDLLVTFLVVENVVEDPCDGSRALREPAVGPSVDDLVDAISGLAGFQATDPVTVTGQGFTGKQFAVRAPMNPPCGMTELGLGTWSSAERINGVARGEVNVIRILDVRGVRLMIAGAYGAGWADEHIAEIEQLIGSIQAAP